MSESEKQLQKRCTDRLDAMGIWWSHVPNRVFRGRKVGKNVKSQPDLIFVVKVMFSDTWQGWASHTVRAIACELKIPGGAWKAGQRERLAKMMANGWEGYKITSVSQFEKVLDGTEPQLTSGDLK